MKSGQHEPLGGGEAVVRYNLSFLLQNKSFSESHWDTCLLNTQKRLFLESILFLLRSDMESVDCVVPDVVCDDLAAEGNITSPLPSGDTFQVKHSLTKEINESSVRNPHPILNFILNSLSTNS